MRTLLIVTLLISVTLITGCGVKNPYGTVLVSGAVTVDGKPMEGININFVPVLPDNLGAYGTTQADGSFVLTTGGAVYGGGAQPGQYHVTFSKTDIEEKYKVPAAQGNGGAAPFVVLPPLIDVIPPHYGDPKTSGIAPVTVEKGKKNHFEFGIKTK